MAHPQQPPQNLPVRGRRVYRVGRDEFRAIWPVAVIAALWIAVIYAICLYESLFQLPLLAPVK